MAFPSLIAAGSRAGSSGRTARESISGTPRRAGVAGVFLVLLFFLLNISMVNAQQQPKPEEKQDVYQFDAGDVVEVFVFEEPEISQTVTVRSDGRISLPLIGDVMAAGMTSEALAQTITEKLAKFIEAPNVTVMLAESHGKVYYVLGQIEEPGEYSISRPVTVIQAIARAGGFLEWAKKSRIMIVSGSEASEKVTYFDYDRFLDKPGRESNVRIQAGDTIVIP